jgi:hypothetical protein
MTKPWAFVKIVDELKRESPGGSLFVGVNV